MTKLATNLDTNSVSSAALSNLEPLELTLRLAVLPLPKKSTDNYEKRQLRHKRNMLRHLPIHTSSPRNPGRRQRAASQDLEELCDATRTKQSERRRSARDAEG